jgi:hypothetical protein
MNKFFHLIIILLTSSLFTACLKDQCTETRTFERWDPVYRTQAQLDAPISVETPRALEQPGIIYAYNNYILINEYQEGIHVINNTDPVHPVNEAFIRIEGNEHFAVMNHQLQANKYQALLTIDIHDVKHPQEKSRINNAFQEPYLDPGRGYLVGYRRSDETMTLDCSSPNFNSLRWSSGNQGGWFLAGAFNRQFDFVQAVTDNAGNNAGPGTGGSTARFTITANHLYAVTDYDLKVFDLANPSQPALRNTVNLGWGIETIYPFKDKLFIGSNVGMHVFDISTPSSPAFQSMFEHVRACDPVVADDQTAYVTLRDGTECEGFQNQLDVIDIDNILSPHLLQTYPMKNPHGLALSGDILYVCEGLHGLKVLNVSDRKNIREVDFHQKIKSTDVIALPNETLLVVGEDGLMQFDVKDPEKMKMLSKIPVIRS